MTTIFIGISVLSLQATVQTSATPDENAPKGGATEAASVDSV